MFKKIILFCFVLGAFQACKNEPAGQETTAAENTQPAQPLTGTAALEANSVEETDYIGRVQATLKKVQKEFDLTQGKMDGQGKVTMSIDGDFNLTIEREVGSDVIKSVVNLKNLNPNDGGMTLIPDAGNVKYPGMRLLVMEGKPGVVTYKNGQKEKEERFLEIYLPQRHNIENIAPALSSILNVVHGKVQ